MGQQLCGVYAKLRRAEEHYNALNVECIRFFERHPHGLSDEFYALPPDDLPGVPVGIEPFTEASPRFGLLIGDIATNLRASLDHLAWQVALLNTPKPKWTTQFPICTGTKDFASKAPRYLTSVDDVHRALFKQVQPYKRRTDAESDPLALLNKIVNTDKHRVLLLTMVGIDPDTEGAAPLERSAERPRAFQTTEPRPGVYVQGDTAVDIAFDEPGTPLDARNVMATFRDAANCITTEVLPRFEPLFP